MQQSDISLKNYFWSMASLC